MKVLVQNGRVVGTANLERELTQAEYDALPEAEKNSGDYTYFVKDYGDTDHARVVNMAAALGNTEQLSNIADGTVFGAIKDLYDRLGGLFLSVDPEYKYLQVRDNAENISHAIPELSANMTEAEKVAWLMAIMGSSSDLEETGYSTVVSAIIDMYQRLNNLSIAMNDDGTVTLTDNA